VADEGYNSKSNEWLQQTWTEVFFSDLPAVIVAPHQSAQVARVCETADKFLSQESER